MNTKVNKPLLFEMLNPDAVKRLSVDKASSVHPAISDNLLWNLLESIPMNISVWKDGRIIYANSAFYDTIGVKKGDIQTLNLKAMNSDFFIIHPEDFSNDKKEVEVLKEELNTGKLFHKEIRMKNSSDREFSWYNTYVVRAKEKNSGITIEIDENITEKKLAAERLNEALKEKEVLLKEIHHRVKNNFQVISSLLRLQQSKVADCDLKDVLLESENRVRTMAMIHESLYMAEDVASIDFDDYINKLVKNLVEAYSGRSRLVKFNIQAENIHVGVDIAIPCSLIINELVSNSFKHGFDDSMKPELLIKLTKKKSDYELTVRDNGVGYPDSFYEKQPNSLGIMLVKTLASQLGGEVEFKNVPGAEVKIKFEG